MEESKGSSGSTGSKRVGNTKRPSPAKHWTFTWSPPLDLEEDFDPYDVGSVGSMVPYVEEIFEELKTKCEKIAMQIEIGDEEKRLHLQAYVCLKKKSRPINMFETLDKTVHWEKCRAPKNTRDYCRKLKGRVMGPWEYGVPKKIVTIQKEQLREDQREIADKYIEDEDPVFGREIHWYWERTGGWGKSILCKYLVDQMGALVVQGASKDVLCGIARWIEKNDEAPRMVVFDIPRVNQGHVSYQAMEAIKNGCFFSGKYESGMVRFNSPHILVFANEPPERTKLSQDRWCVFALRDESEVENEVNMW